MSYSTPPSFFFKVCLRFVYGHSACVYVHALRMCPVAHGTQKTLIELQMVVSHMWVLGLNSGPLQEQQELLTAEPSLQAPTMISFNVLSRSSLCEALPETDVVVCAGSPLPGLTTSGIHGLSAILDLAPTCFTNYIFSNRSLVTSTFSGHIGVCGCKDE